MALLPKANFVVTYPDQPLRQAKTFPTEKAARTFATAEAVKRRMRVSIFDPVTSATETVLPPSPAAASVTPSGAEEAVTAPPPPETPTAAAPPPTPAEAAPPPVYTPRIPRAVPEPATPLLRPLASRRTGHGPVRADRTPRTTRTEPEAPTSW